MEFVYGFGFVWFVGVVYCDVEVVEGGMIDCVVYVGEESVEVYGDVVMCEVV